MTTRKASSSTEGFFQALPVVPPLFTYNKSKGLPKSDTTRSDDEVLDRVLSLYIPSNAEQEVCGSIHEFCRLANAPSTLRLTVDCEINQPSLHPLNTFGDINKVDPLRTSEGWRGLKKIGILAGTVAKGYPQPGEASPVSWNRRVQQFGLIHVWSGADALVMCPASMTDGAAKLLSTHLKDSDGDQPGLSAVLNEVYKRLISPDPGFAWSSGQWMTERPGGSNVRDTETTAKRLSRTEINIDNQNGRQFDAHGMPLGPWWIDGFKWFSSATDSDMALMLAYTENGLSAFYAPMRRRSGDIAPGQNELNGIRIQRLKNKMGTKGLPTAELELRGTRGWLIGQEGKGVKEISTLLNLTRLHTAMGGTGYWARSLTVSRAFTKVRNSADGPLAENPQHLRWMAAETVKYWAAVHLSFFGTALLGASEQESVMRETRAQKLIPDQKSMLETLLRLLTPVMKARVSLQSVLGVRECMESLGGVGYCENNEDGGILNIARIFRDSVVGPIWEGTVNIMAEDTIRVIKDKRLGGGNVLENVLQKWAETVLKACEDGGRFHDECAIVRERLAVLVKLTEEMEVARLHWEGRNILEHIEAVVCSCLLMYDASVDGDKIVTEIAKRWVWSKALVAHGHTHYGQDWRGQVALDKRIFLGANPQVTALQARL
ncbi:uncharacterized protein PV07_08380, partial [Cladophialophora immunda]